MYNECRLIQQTACTSERCAPGRAVSATDEPMSGWERVRGVPQGSMPPDATACHRQAPRQARSATCGLTLSTSAQLTLGIIAAGRDGRGAKRTHPFTTTMLRPACRTTRSAVRLLADSKPSQTLMLQKSRPLHEHTLVNPSLVSQNDISATPASVSIPRLQTRPFTSASRSSARHLRSDDRHRKAAVNPHLVDPTNDDLPRKGRKANPFLPFQASSFVDAFVTTIVGVGISESNKHERAGT